MNKITRVVFGNGRTYYFGSIAAIFDVFTEDEIGASINDIWASKLAPGTMPFSTSKCVISKHFIHRKKQSNK